jgi:hypothetical protein
MHRKVFFLITIVSILAALMTNPPALNAQEDQTDFARVGGTFDNMIQAALCNTGGVNLMDPTVAGIVRTGEASLESTTIGNCIASTPGGDPNAGSLQLMGNNLATVMTTRPVSANTYLADVIQNITGATPAYAQTTGVGFDVLDSILPIWKAFRNMAYIIYILIFVVVGFMIMFRTKIDPQTVVSIQTALPRLIITLLLITFSYAIAGLLIDLIYVLIYIAAALMTPNIFTNAEKVREIILNHSVFSLLFLSEASNSLLANPADAAGAIVSNLIGGVVGGIAGWFTEGLARLLFSAVALFAAIKLFISLGLSFVKIILAVIFAPLILILNAFPGSNSFSSWFRGLMANVMVFPAVALLFMVAAAVIGPDINTGPNTGTANSNYWGVAPGIGYGSTADQDGWAPPFLLLRQGASGPAVSAIGALIGYFMLIMSPKIPELINEFFKGSKFNFASAIGQSLGQGAGLLGWYPQRKYSQYQQTKQAEQQAKRQAYYINNPELVGR